MSRHRSLQIAVTVTGDLGKLAAGMDRARSELFSQTCWMASHSGRPGSHGSSRSSKFASETPETYAWPVPDRGSTATVALDHERDSPPGPRGHGLYRG